MASIRLLMDVRRADSSGRYPIRISINKLRTTVYIATGFSLFQKEWNQSRCVCISHPHRQYINQVLQQKLLDAQLFDLKEQMKEGYSKLTAAELKAMICSDGELSSKGDFEEYYVKVADTKSESTKALYLHTLSRIKAYIGDKISELNFTDITPEWLIKFDAYLTQTAPSANARSIHMRNIRAVFNSALDDEKISNYPFRKFKIKQTKTVKRSLSVEKLRSLFEYPCQPYQRRHIDMFKLIFMLRGINMADLSHLKRIEDGRINYERAKTHKLYSVKVEPEALEIIEKYRGKDWLLDIMDRYGKHQDYTKRANRSLQAIGELKILPGKGGKKDITPAFPGLTMYWARHTWATVAASLDIPKEVIAAGLGHGSDTVTDIYIDFDETKVDRANRMILDWVLYGERKIWNG